MEKAGRLELFATMSSSKAPGESFQARLLWNSYPSDPPSMKFRDPATGRLDLPTAWPILPGFRPKNLDACVSWTAEGFGLHPDWKSDARYRWDPRGNVLLKVLRYLQAAFDDSFGGRFRE